MSGPARATPLGFTLVPIFLCMLAPAGSRAEPFASTDPDDLRPRIVPNNEEVLILAPAALLRFQIASEAWTITTAAENLPAPPLRALTLSGGNLWVTGEGAGVSDARFDDWQAYAPGEGYPGRVIHDVEADEDYAYAATDAGAARFDAYTLEWESIAGAEGAPLGPSLDVAVGEDRVWFALAGGVAEYWKDAESIRIETQLGTLASPRVLALRRTTRFLWALTDRGLARYDISLRSWTSFPAGVDLPDARVRRMSLQGEDVWLGTDAGLWRFRADAGIWRCDESADTMPGERVRAFAIETDRIWVATERAFALYEREAARWIDFSSSVPMPAADAVEIASTGGILLIVGSSSIAYGLNQGQSSPSLFTWRDRPIPEARIESGGSGSGWRFGLDEEGLGLRSAGGSSLHLRGGGTLFVENERGGAGGGLGELGAETRFDLLLNGRLSKDRTLSGFYNTTDPDNAAYQLTYRGARSDAVRLLSLGEIEQEPYNTRLTPGTGFRGGTARVEIGSRSEETRRRTLTADAWAGERRTLPGRDVFRGGSREVEGRTRDTDYVRRQVFKAPDGWTRSDLARAVLYLDDDDPETDDANTESRELAGRFGSWDRLVPNRDYVLGATGGTILLSAAMREGQALVAVSEAGGAVQVDLTDLWMRNHYRIALDPVPGSLEIAIRDSTGADRDGLGRSYLGLFRLDADGDGRVDPERFSPISGLLSFPYERSFPPEVYAEHPHSLYAITYAYASRRTTFRLGHTDVVPGSERITLDREVLRPDVDYSMIPSSGLFIFYETVPLDEDSVIEVAYDYEVDEDSGDEGGGGIVTAGQLGLAANDHLFVGMNAARWGDGGDRDVTTAGVNARLEWKDADRFLRVTPEVALGAAEGASRGAAASGVGIQGRHGRVEFSAAHRSLGDGFTSFEDRRTLLGRLREDSEARGRIDLGRDLHGEIDWNRSLSDSAATDSTSFGSSRGWGEESSVTAKLRLLRGGLPNLEIRRGRLLLDAPGMRQEKWITRADIEISPDQAGIAPLGIRRLWLRAFLQRSERSFALSDPSAAADSAEDRTTDHAFVRLNGSTGVPLSWNVAFEDRRTRRDADEGGVDARRFQEIDATVQSQPHASCDAFVRWEANRDLFREPGGASAGFQVHRLLLGTVYLYPGRIARRLTPLSFRLDLGRSAVEEGEPGGGLPGAGSLWRTARDASRRRQSTNGVFEARLQILSWIRLVERYESESDREEREALTGEGTMRRLENRLEIRPRAGLVTLRAITQRDEEKYAATERRHRFLGEWDQTWGRGILTYAALEAHRSETRDRAAGDRTRYVNPQGRITWRRSQWKTDATLGGSLSWLQDRDASAGSTASWRETRRQAIAAALSVQPLRLLTLKGQYELTRSRAPSGEGWANEHNLRLRFLIRA